MIMTLFDDEQILKAYTKDVEDTAARKIAERLIKIGKMSLEEIALCVPSLSLEELREIKKELIPFS